MPPAGIFLVPARKIRKNRLGEGLSALLPQGKPPPQDPSRRALSFLRYSVGQSMWVRCSFGVHFVIKIRNRYPYIGVLFCVDNNILFLQKILEKLRKNRKKHLQNGHTSCIMIRHGNFSVVIYTTHPGTCRSSVLSRENSNPNRFSDTHFPQCCRKSLENTNGYSLRDFLCLEKSGRLKTAKHLST